MGASSGIGREAALRFADRGARVVVSARGEEGLASLVEEIRGRGGEATYVVADTSEFGQVEALAEHVLREYGTLDTWVHLAAVGLFATFEDTTPEEFARVVDVNLMGQVYGAMAASLHLSEATVKRHLANLYPKIGVSSRGEAVRVALSKGWISPREMTDAPDRT